MRLHPTALALVGLSLCIGCPGAPDGGEGSPSPTAAPAGPTDAQGTPSPVAPTDSAEATPGAGGPTAPPQGTAPPGTEPPAEETAASSGAPTPVPVVIHPGGDLPIVPPDPPAEPGRRARHRMDIDQLNASIRRATGGIGWAEVAADGSETDLFEDLALTLGRPDFIDSTQEDLAPSLLFEKFLGDAARSVCRRLVERELSQPPGERVLMVHAPPELDPLADPDATQRNLSMLLLRFHGRAIEPSSDALNPWTWLIQSTVHVSEGAAPADAWEAVCVALITHPDFYTY